MIKRMATIALETSWDTYLKHRGVKLPKRGKLRLALNYLYDNIGKDCHIDDIKSYVASTGEKLTGSDPLQVRHLSTQKGWYIKKTGKYYHCLVNITETYPGFIADKRKTMVKGDDWHCLKKEYGYMCVNCGSKEGEPMRWKLTSTTVLQKGHMDPRKDLTLDNCIPQCSFCNQSYKDKAVFNKRGIVVDWIKEFSK